METFRLKDNRTISVAGSAKVVAKADLVSIDMSLKSKKKDYEKAMVEATEQIDKLRKALTNINFNVDDLKTTYFNVSAEYNSWYDKSNKRHEEFEGYEVVHRLNLKFDFTNERLSETLTAITSSGADPRFDIEFKVKDVKAIADEVLRVAGENARDRAQTLCKVMNVELGELLKINYNWPDADLVSPTHFRNENNGITSNELAVGATPDITPDDVEVNDEVGFVWEIK